MLHAAQPNSASGPPLVKFLCGADVLESFAIPGVWRPEHVIFAFDSFQNGFLSYLDVILR